MPKKPKYPYPAPELIAYLNEMQASTRDDEHDYTVLANLLTFCHATVAHANELWHAGRFTDEEPDLLTYRAIQFGFKRLIPLIIGSTVSGWHELLAYVEHPEEFPWYNPDTDWSCPPELSTSARMASLEEISSYMTALPGNIYGIEYTTANGRRWVSHIVDREFLRAWMKHPNFYMVK